MEWNLEQLLEIKNNLLKLSANPEKLDVSDRFKYANDLFLIDEMICFLRRKENSNPIDMNITSIVDTTYYKHIIEWINTYGSSIFLNIRPYGDEKVKTKLIYRRNYMFNEDLVKILKEFFSVYNPELIPFLENMIKNNQLSFANTKNSIFDANSLLNLMSSGNSYIVQNDTLNLADIQYLAKNIQSAYDFKNADDKLKQNINLSPLAYAKGRLAQFAFLDYLKQTNYAEEASVNEGKRLNEFFDLVDDGIGNFVTPSMALIVNNHLTTGKYSNYIKHILSTMQAYNWLEKYRQDPDGLKAELAEFDKSFGINELDKIDNKKVREMDNSIANIENEYVRTRTLYH